MKDKRNRHGRSGENNSQPFSGQLSTVAAHFPCLSNIFQIKQG